MVTKTRKEQMTVAELLALRGDRSVYVWGAAIVGMGITRTLERIGSPPAAFLDKSPRFQNTTVMGYPVEHPDTLLGRSDLKEKVFLIVASGHYEDEIAGICGAAGLKPGEDFISARELSPLDPSIDISGMCNLRCISCPQGNLRENSLPRGFMSTARYEAALGKLLDEVPLLGSVQICCWGEPLLNPDAAAIIETTVRRKVLCAVSTNLNIRRDFSGVVAARPDWFRVSVSGYGASYERTHTGGDWELLYGNLHKLKEYKEKFHPGMYVEVDYHLYRHNRSDEYRAMTELCDKLDFAFRPAWAYLYPLDNVKAYCEGEPLSEEAEHTLALLQLGIDEGLARARRQAHLPCPEERCFPITWDMKVRSCGTYFIPTIEENFLATPLREILERRDRSGICDECRRLGLHRYTAVYVEEPLPARLDPPQEK